MARVLIVGSALGELRSVRPLRLRRRLVAELSALDGGRRDHRLAGGGLCRVRDGELYVLYRVRPDRSVVVTHVGGGADALHSRPTPDPTS